MSTSTETGAQAREGGAPVLRAEGVTLRFGGLTSLDHVGLTLHTGEILAVIGPNGAGKTSLFNSLTGVYLPQEGSIEFLPDGQAGAAVQLVKNGMFNRRSSRKPHLVNRAGISRTFQNIRLFNALTVLENVQIAAETRSSSGPVGVMLGLPRNRKNERAARQHSRDMLEFVGLRGKENAIASSLSYGDQRRLEIARAMASDPKVLLLDEPAAGTNPSEKLGLAELIQRINTELGISILLIEHDMRLVMSVAHRITVLNFGKVIASGAPSEVQQNPAVIEAYLGSGAAEEAAAEASAESAAPVQETAPVPDAVPTGAADDALGARDAEDDAAQAAATEPVIEAAAVRAPSDEEPTDEGHAAEEPATGEPVAEPSQGPAATEPTTEPATESASESATEAGAEAQAEAQASAATQSAEVAEESAAEAGSEQPPAGGAAGSSDRDTNEEGSA